MMMMMMMIKIIRLPALGGGDHRVLHAGKQQVRARHSFAWVPCAQVLVLGTWYLVLGTGYPAHKLVRIGKRQEEMKGGGGWILVLVQLLPPQLLQERPIPVEGSSSLSQLSELVSTGRGR